MAAEDCSKQLDKIAKDSLVISRLLKAFEANNCNSEQILAPFNSNTENSPEVRDQLAHELILQYDRCRAHFNELNVRHQACSHIRAFNLSGECKWTRELFKHDAGLFGSFVLHQKECVRRETKKKLLSQLAKDGGMMWKEGEVDEAIERVFMRCYMDTEPLWHPMTK